MNEHAREVETFFHYPTRWNEEVSAMGQMRLSVSQTHKNVWKRAVTKISVMLHFQSGNFHRVMTTHIKT